eukprot:6189506-Pleurochrysis_carterae.AAC.1
MATFCYQHAAVSATFNLRTRTCARVRTCACIYAHMYARMCARMHARNVRSQLLSRSHTHMIEIFDARCSYDPFAEDSRETAPVHALAEDAELQRALELSKAEAAAAGTSAQNDLTTLALSLGCTVVSRVVKHGDLRVRLTVVLDGYGTKAERTRGIRTHVLAYRRRSGRTERGRGKDWTKGTGRSLTDSETYALPNSHTRGIRHTEKR